MATAIGSLVVEAVLTLHVIIGLVFVALVAVHVMQRRNTSVSLPRRLIHPDRLHHRPGRLEAPTAGLRLVARIGSTGARS
jgi:hypothetical protein